MHISAFDPKRTLPHYQARTQIGCQLRSSELSPMFVGRVIPIASLVIVRTTIVFVVIGAHAAIIVGIAAVVRSRTIGVAVTIVRP